MLMPKCFKVNEELVRGTSNLLIERRLSIVVFEIYVFLASIKEEMPNKGVSEIIESIPLKKVSLMLWMSLRKIDLLSEKNGQCRR